MPLNMNLLHTKPGFDIPGSGIMTCYSDENIPKYSFVSIDDSERSTVTKVNDMKNSGYIGKYTRMTDDWILFNTNDVLCLYNIPEDTTTKMYITTGNRTVLNSLYVNGYIIILFNAYNGTINIEKYKVTYNSSFKISKVTSITKTVDSSIAMYSATMRILENDKVLVLFSDHNKDYAFILHPSSMNSGNVTTDILWYTNYSEIESVSLVDATHCAIIYTYDNTDVDCLFLSIIGDTIKKIYDYSKLVSVTRDRYSVTHITGNKFAIAYYEYSAGYYLRTRLIITNVDKALLITPSIENDPIINAEITPIVSSISDNMFVVFDRSTYSYDPIYNTKTQTSHMQYYKLIKSSDTYEIQKIYDIIYDPDSSNSSIPLYIEQSYQSTYATSQYIYTVMPYQNSSDAMHLIRINYKFYVNAIDNIITIGNTTNTTCIGVTSENIDAGKSGKIVTIGGYAI